jgi:amino acid transporter
MPEPEQGEAAPPARNRFGTFGGVFTPSILTILGVIMFMRANFVVGQAGVFHALLILCAAKTITVLTSLSIASVSTNMQVKGGGSYYMISRVLGPEFGGAIGIALFFALALSVPFYVLGFTEALCRTWEGLAPHFQLIAFVTAAVLFGVTWVGANWAIKAQYVIMAFLVLAILSFMGGAAWAFDPATLAANWGPPEQTARLRQMGLPVLSFWAIFAIYFPAVTGIDAGVNMSGDLENPGRSIPRGTLSAVGVGLVVYAVQMVLFGGAAARADLIDAPYQTLRDLAIGGGFLVAAGVFAATISSAIGSYLGAPRVLQAVARDPILTVLHPFAKGTPGSDEPRRALVFVGLITAGILLLAGNEAGGGALNIVAAIVTMFFLCSYGLMNLAAFVEAFGQNPSFRPRFRYFHWATALAGAGVCALAAFLVHALAAAAAVLIVAGLYAYVSSRQLKSTFGDARRGFVYSRARDGLLALRDMPEDARNWRPNILVFSGNPHSRETLVSFAVWLEAGRGVVILGNVLAGALDERFAHRRAAERQLRTFCRERGLHAFSSVVVAESVEEGIRILLQTAGIGPIRANLALFGWPEAMDGAAAEAFCGHLRLAARMEKSLVVVCERPGAVPLTHKRIDLWWRGRENGSLMLLLAWLLTCNWEWSGARIRIMRRVEDEAGREPAREALETLVRESRIDAAVHVIVDDRPFEETLRAHSGDAACVLLGFRPPEAGEAAAWHRRYAAWVQVLPTTLFVSSVESPELTS